jgi:hypothetical protein
MHFFLLHPVRFVKRIQGVSEIRVLILTSGTINGIINIINIIIINNINN